MLPSCFTFLVIFLNKFACHSRTAHYRGEVARRGWCTRQGAGGDVLMRVVATPKQLI